MRTKAEELDAEEARLIQLRNEKTKYEKEIELLKIRSENQQRDFQDRIKTFNEQRRADIDKIERQLYENKLKSERLDKTQMDVNQLKAAIESDLQKQKDLLLKKEVELTDRLNEVTKLKHDLAARLSAVK